MVTSALFFCKTKFPLSFITLAGQMMTTRSRWPQISRKRPQKKPNGTIPYSRSGSSWWVCYVGHSFLTLFTFLRVLVGAFFQLQVCWCIFEFLALCTFLSTLVFYFFDSYLFYMSTTVPHLTYKSDMLVLFFCRLRVNYYSFLRRLSHRRYRQRLPLQHSRCP